MNLVYLVVVVLLSLFGLSFAGLNAQIVHFNYFIATQSLPLSLLLMLFLVAGACIGMASATLWIWRLKRQCRRLRRDAKRARQECDRLRIAAVKEEH
jgi:uncharacterized integral membrane protein